jgi:hypothetical protein
VHPTLQEAVDAVPNGGTLQIREGVFEIASPVFVRDKWITIEGRGCDELSARPSASSTHLMGAELPRDVPATDVVGLLNYVNAGGIVRNLEISGFDAGIRSDDGPPADPTTAGDGSRMLRLERVCITETGRGVSYSATTMLTIRDSLIRDTTWNGISAFTVEGSSAEAQGGFIQVTNSQLRRIAGACMVFKNRLFLVEADVLEDCGFQGGISAVGSLGEIRTSVVRRSLGPGIQFIRGAALISYVLVEKATKGGIIIDRPTSGAVLTHVGVQETAEYQGAYGDGLIILGNGQNQPFAFFDISQSFSGNNARAGMGNFGAFSRLAGNVFQCNAFDLDGESWDPNSPPVVGYAFEDAGLNTCGCPSGSTPCVAQSSALAPPKPLPPSE